jgi:hypothetical protein
MEESVPLKRSVPGRFGIGVNVLLQLLLGVVIFLAVNVLSYRYYKRWDLSPAESYTLSSSSLNYLRKLSKEVELTVIMARSSSLYDYVSSLTEEYRRHGKKLIRVEYLDPTLDLERTEQVKAATSLSLEKTGILLRALGRSRFITEEELIIATPGPDKDHPTIHLRGEDAITSALDGLLTGGERKFYLVSGKGARSEADFETVMSALNELGRQQNFTVQALNLGSITEVPGDAHGVILAGARYDLSAAEAAVVQAYWDRRRSGMLFLLDPQSNTPRLDEFLTSVGITPRGDRVLYAESTATGAKKQMSVEAGFSSEAILTRSLRDASTTLSGQTQSLQLRLDDAALREESITVLPLMAARERYWGETDYLDDLPTAGDGDTLPPVHLAASAERGAVTDKRLQVESSRLVVVGNATMLDPRTRLEPNQDFVAAALNWMISRERMIGITPKPRPLYRIQLTSRQRDLIFWVTAAAGPAAILTIGLLVWASRRAA